MVCDQHVLLVEEERNLEKIDVFVQMLNHKGDGLDNRDSVLMVGC